MADAWGITIAETIAGEQITASCERCGWHSVIDRHELDTDIGEVAQFAVQETLAHVVHCPVNSETQPG